MYELYLDSFRTVQIRGFISAAVHVEGLPLYEKYLVRIKTTFRVA
jgi:hypothetical protein